MTIKIDIKALGIDETRQRVNEQFDAFYQRVADTMLDEVRAYTPVRTGLAQSSWVKNTNKKKPQVSNSVPYVPYLEKGTTRMRAANNGKGIIGPALTSTKGKI